MPPEGIVYRPQTDADLPFLARLYASTRADEMAMVPWTAEQKSEFLAMQFNAQWTHYQGYYPDCDYLVIERAGEAIGRIYIDRTPEEITLIDIALVPEARGAGIGSRLVEEILREAEQARVSVTIHVERFNPALRLYERLGFKPESENGVYYMMRWTPPVVSAAV